MAVPKKRTSRSKRDMRRSHDHAKLVTLTVDEEDNSSHIRHHVSANGNYRGKKMVEIKVKAPKEEQED